MKFACFKIFSSDLHMKFHILGTHPNNTNSIAKVKFVATGINVWATFFDQHNSTLQVKYFKLKKLKLLLSFFFSEIHMKFAFLLKKILFIFI